MFISFDGVDGAGKSTQIELFRQWLEQQQQRVEFCRDPGSTELGEILRGIVLENSDIPIDRTSEMLLYMASRAQLVKQVIRPALAAGKTVISDRFLLANVVYQGYAGGLDVGELWRVGEVAVGGLHPDVNLVLDLDVTAAQQRIERRLDRMEAQGSEFLERVRHGFLHEAQLDHERIIVINADRPVHAVQHEIRAVVTHWMKSLTRLEK
ncbi:MAG: dTMP kinase [Planctomycetota bacterium]